MIGEFSLFQVDGDGLLAQCLDLYQACDIRAETFAAFEELQRRERASASGPESAGLLFDVVPLGFVLLNRLYIKPAYRGKEYGLVALQMMIQRFRMGAGLVVMKPFPLQFEGRINERIPPSLNFPGAGLPPPRSCGRTTRGSGSSSCHVASTWRCTRWRGSAILTMASRC